jgi:hypothetical protein
MEQSLAKFDYGDEPSTAKVLGATELPSGILVHDVLSPYQSGQTKIEVLLPEPVTPGATHKVLYLLPVEPHDGRHCGDAIAEICKHDLHNKYRLICVRPTFSHAPWYADHPTDPQIRQESHFLNVVLPHIQKTYPVRADPAGRLLLGFSKSGWGAYSLLLRHPDTFFKAAAWDAPLAWESPTRYGMGEVFSCQQNMDRYCIGSLLEQSADQFAGSPRFALLGFSIFRGQHQHTHFRMSHFGISHEYQDGPRRDHRWDSGWVPTAVEFLSTA